MEWIEGVKLTNKEGMAAAGLSITDFVNVGIECTLRQLLEAGYFHADPHPGQFQCYYFRSIGWVILKTIYWHYL